MHHRERSICPRNNSIPALVPPQPGQYICMISWNRHGILGNIPICCKRTKTAIIKSATPAEAFTIKKSLFKIPFVGRLIHGCNYICLDRKNLKQELLAIRKGINILNDKSEKCSVGVFPEGTRTLNEDYSLAEFRPGCFNLAKKSHVPIVIFALKNTDKVNNGLLIKIHHIWTCNIF